MYSLSQCFLMCKNFMTGFNAVTLPISSCSKAWTILTEGHDIHPGLIHLVVSLTKLLKTGIDEPRQVQMTICEGFPGCHEALSIAGSVSARTGVLELLKHCWKLYGTLKDVRWCLGWARRKDLLLGQLRSPVTHHILNR